MGPRLSESRIAAEVRLLLAAEIRAAGGREVSFVADVDAIGIVTGARAVARGTVHMVLALPGVAQRGQMLLHNHPTGHLEPSEADLSVAARLHDGGVGFGILDNTAERLYVVVEVPRERSAERLDPYAVVETLGEHGPVARVLGQYEDRPSQRDMAAYIADGYNDGGVLVLEAGTGVGKSFAYLVPALAWSRANGERTIVSTNTINLQEQLVGKDLPMLREALAVDGWTPKFALLKGWRNYLCLSRLQHATGAQQSLLEPERQDELLSLAEWASRTADGTLSDLAVQPSSEVWDEICAEADLCTRIQCPYFDQCFLFKARRRAAEADIVVVNHHLLAADLAVRQASDNWEEAFSDVNAPLHAWAAWRVYKIEAPAGKRDRAFLASVFQKLLLNFTWWVNRKDPHGDNLFSGGFLGLDNIGVFDRSQPLPTGGHLEQADGTAWMAFYSATMLAISLELAQEDSIYEDMASKFFEHFVAIVDAMNTHRGDGLWDEQDGFYYDALHADGKELPLRVRSMVGLLPPARRRGARRRRARARAGVPQTLGVVLAQPPRARAPRHSAPSGRTLAHAARDPFGRSAAARAPVSGGRARVPRAEWRALALALPQGEPLRVLGWRRRASGRLPAGRVGLGLVRRQLELARTDLVPRELSAGRSARALRPLSTATHCASSARRARAAH